VYTVVE
jgi:hypothetical protein